jgi:hypothetical protein
MLHVFPNPLSTVAIFMAAIPPGGRLDIEIFDIAGRRRRTLTSARAAGGRAEISWDGRDAAGRLLPPGVYLARSGASGPGLLKVILVR